MDSLSLKVYKGLEIKKWTARHTYKIGFNNLEKISTLPQLCIRKFHIFIFLKLFIEFEFNRLTILGPIGNSCLSARQIT